MQHALIGEESIVGFFAPAHIYTTALIFYRVIYWLLIDVVKLFDVILYVSLICFIR